MFKWIEKYNYYIENKPGKWLSIYNIPPVKKSSINGIMKKDILNIDDYISNEKIDILNYIDSWINMKQWYIKNRLVHKLGLLFYGEPGTGKTSIIKILASYFNMILVIVDLTQPLENISSSLRDVIMGQSSKDGFIVVFEEIDTVIPSDNANNIVIDDNSNKLTWLIQLLDGLESYNDVIYIATTNFYDKIDFRLKRKGRFDKEIEFKAYTDQKSIDLMCKKFNVDPKEISLDCIRDGESITPVELQDKCINYLFKQARDMLNKENK